MNIIDPVTKKPRVMREMCRTCVGHPGNKADLRPGRLKQLVRENSGPDATGLICHSSIEYDEDDDGNPVVRGENALCRWFLDTFGLQANFIRICYRLGAAKGEDFPFTEVDPPDKTALSGPPAKMSQDGGGVDGPEEDSAGEAGRPASACL